MPEHEYDVVVLGAGAAGMAAGLFAALRGLSAVVIEKAPVVGGTTALSAGTAWIPGTFHAETVQPLDTRAGAERYLRSVVGNRLAERKLDAFLTHGPGAVRELHDRTVVRFRARPHHPDYMSDRPGASLRGRALEPLPFDGRLLGPRLRLLRRPLPGLTLWRMMLTADDIRTMLNARRSPRSAWGALRQVARHVADRVRHGRGTSLLMVNAFWAPVSVHRRQRRHRNATENIFPHFFLDRGKPGVLAVDRTGRRFANEATSYDAFVRGMYAAGLDAVPCWLIADARAARTYGLGLMLPGYGRRRRLLRDGYLRRASTLPALAASLGLPADALAATVDRFNAHASSGHDSDFRRGETAANHVLGDPAQSPNPCLRPLGAGPFYAVQLQPGLNGTSTGLRTDEHARVLREDSTAIEGLYACGNDMSSLMAGAYPGPGVTIGPALVFAAIAVNDLRLRGPVQPGQPSRVASPGKTGRYSGRRCVGGERCHLTGQ